MLASFLPNSGMRFFVMLALNTCIIYGCFAQNNLRNFTAVQIDKVVYLHWTFEKGFVCTGTTIERSHTDLNFNKIGQIEGICGSFNEPIEFSFTDSLPLPNQLNHYRLKLGSSGYSNTITVLFINFNEDGYSISPHPIGDVSTIFIENKANEKLELIVYDLNGQRVKKIETNTNSIIIRKEDFKSGHYLFQLCFENQKCLKGRFIVL
ncbi:MAG: T9SS type A sorting domain-containing protein [Bacteroidetes bacterium]|nr:T9SS type A sorting domain-containing protein [Bacteroidota bacterium]MBT4729398.1 T9SS type A sorting domain-containing protein [Bacteroidota bacterium]